MTQREAPRPESGLYTGGHAAQQDDEQTIVRLGSSSSLCEEDSDSGSWWSYPSECGSVVDVNRVVSFALHATDDLDSLRSCFASLEGDVVPQSVPSPKQQHQQRSPDYRDSRPANARSGVGDTLDNGCITETAKQPGIPADQVRTALGQINRANLNPTKTFRKSSLVGADDRRPPSAVPSIERHVTFKDLSSPSSGSDEEHYERKPPQYRNRNHSVPAGCHGVGEEKQAFVDNGDVAAVAGEADLDDSGYLDGDSTSSSSDVSPPSSLGWESGIHTTATRKAGGVRDSRGVGQRCPGDHRGNDLFEPEQPKRPDDSNQTDGKQAMNGFYGQNNAVPSAHAFVHTEISVCESVRREDSYEYYRNGTRVAKLNNVNQTSWSESSCTDSSEVCTPLEKPTHLEQTAVSAPGQNKNSARAPEAADDTSDGARHQHHHHQSAPPRRVLPSVDEVQKRQQNVPPSVEVSRKHQQEASGVLPKRQSAPRESGKSKKENNGGNAWNADGARTTTRATKGDVAYEHWRHIPARDVRDEGTSCDLEEGDDADDYDSESEDSGDAPSSPSRDELRECADRADARAGTVSATATSRAVARSRPGGGTASEPASRASALASVRAQARDPFLALAVATAKAATTASAEASREIYAGCKPFSAAPDLDVFVRTACSVGGGESAALLADRAKQARDMPDSGYIAVSSPYKVSSVRADVHLPTPVRYKEFSSLQLGGAASQPGVTTATNGHGELAREPLPCEQRFLHVHSDVLPTREDRSPPTPPPRYTPSPVLREDRVRLLRTPVKSTPVLVDSLPDSDDCDVAAAAAPCPPVPPPRNPHNGILRMTKRPATLPVNGEATVYRKPPLPQQPLQQQQHRLLRPPPPPVRQRSPPADPAEHLERITGYHTARRLAQALPKPQVVLPDQPYSHPGGRLVSSRRRFFENLQRQVVAAADPDADSPSERLLGFQASAQAARESLAKSSPDLAALEADAFRRSRNRPDRYPPVPYSDATPPSPAVPRSPAVPPESFSRLVEETRNRYFLRSGRRPRGSPGQDERRRSKSLGYLETDVDTLQCRQVKRPQDPHTLADPAFPDYSEEEPARADSPLSRARSMDRFLDDEVNAGLGERAKSEHELRVERSLQKLQLPDWYKRHSRPAETGFLRSRRGSTASTTSTGRPAWQGLGSRTPSAASLAATSASAPTTNATNARNLVIPKRVTAPDWRCWHASRESLSSGCASPHDGSLSRWGSVSSAPAAAWSYRSFRQPYLGWRATPSTGTTTPMSTGSRPVSPGASLWTPPPSHPPQQQSETSEVEASAVGSVLRSSPHPPPCSIPRDRYSYVQGIYGDGGGWNDEHDSVQQEQDDACTSSSMRQHRQLDQQRQEVVVSDARPAVWMESSFVGAKPGSSTAGSPASSAAALGEYVRSVGITL